LTEGIVPREMLYIADECFSAAPRPNYPPPFRRSLQTAEGKGGCPITEKLQREFFVAIVEGRMPDALRAFGWLNASGRNLLGPLVKRAAWVSTPPMIGGAPRERLVATSPETDSLIRLPKSSSFVPDPEPVTTELMFQTDLSLTFGRFTDHTWWVICV